MTIEPFAADCVHVSKCIAICVLVIAFYNALVYMYIYYFTNNSYMTLCVVDCKQVLLFMFYVAVTAVCFFSLQLLFLQRIVV